VGLQFSSGSKLGASTRKWGSRFRLGEVEPSVKEDSCFSRMDVFSSVKEFHASCAMISIGLLSVKHNVGHTELFPACYFLRVMPL
jgi:hypothetical protein